VTEALCAAAGWCTRRPGRNVESVYDDVWIVGVEFTEVLGPRTTPIWHAAAIGRR
jgi:hypothetical protein